MIIQLQFQKTVRDYILKTYKIPEKKITVIPRGCDMDYFIKNDADSAWLNKWYKEFDGTFAYNLNTFEPNLVIL